MKIIIPSYNRPIKLERTLAFYKSDCFNNLHEIIVLDGSDDESSSVKIREICRSLNVMYICHQATFMERMIRYCRSIKPQEIIALCPDEDVFLPDFISMAEKFLKDNHDYSAIVGRYATFQKPLGPFHRVSYSADTILDQDIDDEDSVVRSSEYLSCTMAGCPPLFWGIRSAENYLESVELQSQCLGGGSMEVIDQAVLCQQGKIKIVPDVMMLRDETKIGYTHKMDHHDVKHYITSEECDHLLEVASNSRHETLIISIRFWISLYRYSEKSPSINMQWGGNNLQKNIPYFDSRTESYLIRIRFFSLRTLTVFFEILTAYSFISMLNKKYGRVTISKVLKKISLT
jgi:glycosyltransferase domain-containing protein